MPPPSHVRLGKLTQCVLAEAVWQRESEFPAHQPWADDFERILAFLENCGVLNDLLPRLRAREREGTIAEARLAYFFGGLGFNIIDWQPEAVAGRPGDLEVRWQDLEPIFVEVKGPGWEAELSRDDFAMGRQRAPKHIDLEARAVDSVGPMLRAIDKALPKLSEQRCNLVAICEDLFISPLDLPSGWLEPHLADHFRRLECSKVSGVLVLNTQLTGSEVDYRSWFSVNPTASIPIPGPVASVLEDKNAA